MNTSPLVVCCGLATLDILQVVEWLPRSNEKVVALLTTTDFGGPAANAAATVVARGGRARLVTALGSGPVAQLVSQRLSQAGVEIVDLLAGIDCEPPVSTILVTQSSGDRAVVSTNSTAIREQLTLLGHELDDAAVLLVDGHHMELALQLAALARAASTPVLFDGGSWKVRTDELLASIDVAVVSADFTPPNGSDALEYLVSMGCLSAARTNGEMPIQLLHNRTRSEIRVPQLQEGDLVDTLGAGDVFHGALAQAMAVAKPDLDLPAALAESAQVASESCRHHGPRPQSA